LSFIEKQTHKIIRRVFVVGQIKEGYSAAKYLKRDLNHVPDNAILKVIDERDDGTYSFEFETDEAGE
jgi:hypothetical protein